MMKTVFCAALFAASALSLGGALSAEAGSQPRIALWGPAEVHASDAEELALVPKDKKKDKKDDEDKEEDVKLAQLVEPASLDDMLRVRAAAVR